MEKTMKLVKKALCMLATLAMVSACARDMSSNVVTSSAAVGKVLEGTIVSAQAVTIQDNDKLENNSLGMLTGGVVGGIGGSAFGKGTGQGLATAGGAVAGAVLGSMLQKQLSKSQGIQYVVKIDSRHVAAIPANTTTQKREYSYSDDSIDSDVKNSIGMENMQTDLISVVQGNDIILQPGQRVMVIYNNDRPRVVPSTM